jgi:hypothetical protein
MKVAEKKHALQEIYHAKDIRKTVESFQAAFDAIDTDRTALEELKKRLDNPEGKAISERSDAFKLEWDERQTETNEYYANLSSLFQEQSLLQQQLEAIFSERRESTSRIHETDDSVIDEEGSALHLEQWHTESERPNISMTPPGSVGPDYVVSLNNYLQGYRDGTGRMTRHLSWQLEQEGPCHQRTHHATAKCEPFGYFDKWVLSCAVRGHAIGYGRDLSVRNAKKEAARQAMEYFRSLPPNHPVLSIW